MQLAIALPGKLSHLNSFAWLKDFFGLVGDWSPVKKYTPATPAGEAVRGD